MCADHLLFRLLLHEVIHVEREALCSLLREFKKQTIHWVQIFCISCKSLLQKALFRMQCANPFWQKELLLKYK